ncbi:MAG: hypothetical protein H7Z40_10355 [Phycisphaerae bacterium]|nr:hypothetical protein [Gemmatimonadaceae bacterium]
MKELREVSAALLALSLAACSADSPAGVDESDRPPASANLRAYDVRIDARGRYDGALMFDVAGVAVDSVTSNAGSVISLDVVAEPGTGVTARVVYSGALHNGVVATLWVRDVGAAAPRITLQQAAAGESLATIALDEFTVTTTAR